MERIVISEISSSDDDRMIEMSEEKSATVSKFVKELKKQKLYGSYIIRLLSTHNDSIIKAHNFLANARPESFISSAFSWFYEINGITKSFEFSQVNYNWAKLLYEEKSKNRIDNEEQNTVDNFLTAKYDGYIYPYMTSYDSSAISTTTSTATTITTLTW